MAEQRKRPIVYTQGPNQNQRASKATRRDGEPSVEGMRALGVRGRGGRRGSRGGGRRSYPLPQASNRTTSTADNNEACGLVSSVTCNSLFNKHCGSDAFSDNLPERLPSSFDNADQYVKTFLPLLHEEAREAVKSSFADACEDEEIWDVSIISTDMQGNDWLKINISLGRFHGRPHDGPRLFQNMIMVLTNVRPSKKDPTGNIQKKVQKQKMLIMEKGQETRCCTATALAATYVQYDRDTDVLVLRARPRCARHRNDANSPCNQAIENLKGFSTGWYLIPAGGVVTQQRECDSLHSLCKIPIMHALLNPGQYAKMDTNQLPTKKETELGSGLLANLRQNYDSSQLEAILTCAAHFSLSDRKEETGSLPALLIQGPPGTGKTHTVHGVLNLWHLTQFERYYRRVLEHYKEGPSTSSFERIDRATTRILMKPRMLVCAPSNAAVDELLKRILVHGFVDSSGQTYKPNLVRIGAEDAPYLDEVRMVLLDTLAMSYMSLSQTDWAINRDRHQQQVQKLEKEISLFEKQLRNQEKSIDELGGEILSRMEKLDKAETEIRRLQIVEGVVNGTSSNDRSVRETLELNFLDNVEMVFTTLSSAGKKILSKVNRGFETVLIDEAAQASEVSTLQPLAYGCQQCVLVGDPQQLPATIISQKGKELNMERSLFARLQEGGLPVKLLETQYRMHPEIRQFPSKFFYDGRLKDGDEVKERPPEVFYHHDLLKPYVVFDVPTGVHERQGSGSLQNQVEADLAVALFKELRDFLVEKHREALQNGSPLPPAVRVGVLTPYKSQTKCLTQTFMRLLGAALTNEVKIQTVDSCQGKQLDVVIFSCVRGATKGSGVGFVADMRRMNVGITRAKKALWILGNFGTLVSHPAWAELKQDAINRECIIEHSTADSLFPQQRLFEQVDLGAKDPRIGVIQPLKEEKPIKTEFPDVAEKPDIPRRSHMLPYPSNNHTFPQRDLRREDGLMPRHPMPIISAEMLQEANLIVSEALLSTNLGLCSLSNRPPPEEPVSTSNAEPHSVDRGEEAHPPTPGAWMLVRQEGTPKVLGPPDGRADVELIYRNSSGVTAVPVSVAYTIQRGMKSNLLQPSASNPSNSTSQ